MGHIALLDQNTINQIAAGEVIERPAAVVKELVENSIDAGANAITVEIKDGGISFIRITDNGSGIEEEDIPLVFLRHSTSKIRTATDLLTVSSLGFRGEALSSVAAIAQVELVTKTSASFSGIRYLLAGGEEKSLEHIGCPNGTTFIIRNLFYNTPARRKFLKSPVTEAGYIHDIMERLIVSHPHISFKFINNNQVKLHTSGNNNLKDNIYHVYGREITSHLEYVESQNNGVNIHGFIAKPVVTRGNRNYENYFVNNRFIKSGLIYKAIEEAYKPYIMSHRYPFTTLFIEIDPEMIDVNVHPAKIEIRFKNSEEVYQSIYHTIKNALEKKEHIPKVALVEEKEERQVEKRTPEPFEINRLNIIKENSTNVEQKEQDLSTSVERNQYEANSSSSHVEGSQYRSNSNANHIERYRNSSNKGTGSDINNLHLSAEVLKEVNQTEIGVLNKVVTDPSGTIQEQNASDQLQSNQLQDSSMNEKSIYGQLLEEQFIKNNSSSQNTVAEHSVQEQFSFLSEEAVKEHRIIGQVFSTYWIVEYGKEMFLIDQHAAHEKVLYEKIMASLKEKGVNSQLLNPPIIITFSLGEEELLKQNMDAFVQIGFEIEEFGGREYAIRSVPNDFYGLDVKDLFIEIFDALAENSYSKTPEMILEKIASLSCKAAVKGNTRLSFEEAKELIDMLLILENPYHCPHGRPTIISMSKYEIEKKFKRIV